MSNGIQSKQKSFEIRRILAPVDSSPNAHRAADVAIQIALDYKAEITFLNVLPAPKFSYGSASVLGTPSVGLDKYYEYAESEAERLIGSMLQLAKARGVQAKGQVVKSSESTVQSIVDEARERNVDLIVMGARGLSSFQKMLVGSVSSGVLTYAQCSVLVTR